MQGETEQSPRTKMESLRTICDREIPLQPEKINYLTALFSASLHSIKALAQDTAQNQGKLAKMKAILREAEDELVKALAAKTHKEAKQMATRDSISAIKTRVEKLKRTVQVQKARREEYATIISQQSLALAKAEDEAKNEVEENRNNQEAISWYNQFLGLQIEGGRGVKFTLKNINIKDPKQEYCFTIRHANDNYSLLDCDPHLNGIKELISELNRTNGLFKFVRVMREKFNEAAALGLQPQLTSFPQDLSAISGPSLSVSTDISESSAKKNGRQIPLREVNWQFKKLNHGSKSPVNKIYENQSHDGESNRHPKKVAKSDISPLVRRSPRFKAKKQI